MLVNNLLLSAAPGSVVPTVQLTNGVLNSSGIPMPVMAAGTGGYKGADAAQAVTRAFGAGFRHLHTAFDYYNLPDIGGALASVPRDSYFISSMTSPCVHPASPPTRNVTDPDACYNLTPPTSTMALAGTAGTIPLHGLPPRRCLWSCALDG